MLYDLNIPWTPQTTRSDLERTLRFSQSLGYNVVALNHTISTPVLSTITNPIPQLGPVHSSFPPSPQQQQTSISISISTSTSSPSTKLPITLRRATVLIADPAVNHRLPTLAATYDILAARPTTEKAFLSACTTMSEISLISLDLTTSFPFRFRPKPCMAAVNRGILFEICYGQLLASSAPDQARARAVFIGNVIEIVRATRGRGIILSSETKGGGGGTLRAPADLANLFAVWGLSAEKGLEALGTNPRSVVVNEGLKRRSFRGVVDIVQVEGQIPGKKDGSKVTSDDENGTEKDAGKKDKQQRQGKKKGGGGGGGGQNSNQKPKGERNNNSSNNKPQTQPHQPGATGKRKHDGASDHGGGGSDQNTATSTSSTPANGAAISKRQAKKMKLAQRAADSPS